MKRLKLLSNKDLLTFVDPRQLPGKYIKSDPRRSEAAPNFSKGENAADFQDFSLFSGYASAENTYQPLNQLS